MQVGGRGGRIVRGCPKATMARARARIRRASGRSLLDLLLQKEGAKVALLLPFRRIFHRVRREARGAPGPVPRRGCSRACWKLGKSLTTAADGDPSNMAAGLEKGGPPCRLAPVFDLEEPDGESGAGLRFRLRGRYTLPSLKTPRVEKVRSRKLSTEITNTAVTKAIPKAIAGAEEARCPSLPRACAASPRALLRWSPRKRGRVKVTELAADAAPFFPYQCRWAPGGSPGPDALPMVRVAVVETQKIHHQR